MQDLEVKPEYQKKEKQILTFSIPVGIYQKLEQLEKVKQRKRGVLSNVVAIAAIAYLDNPEIPPFPPRVQGIGKKRSCSVTVDADLLTGIKEELATHKKTNLSGFLCAAISQYILSHPSNKKYKTLPSLYGHKETNRKSESTPKQNNLK